MEKKISVIVPVYQVEKYLERCIESIIHQTYENLEIILIDDGSKDNCPAICDKYQKMDPRITVIHKENGGLSSARNAGLDIATGDLVTFVDSDDYIEKDMLEVLNSNLKENGCDISVCFWKEVFENGAGFEPTVEDLLDTRKMLAIKIKLYFIHPGAVVVVELDAGIFLQFLVRADDYYSALLGLPDWHGGSPETVAA